MEQFFSLQVLIKQYGLTEGDCNQVVSDAHLECISRLSCEHWRKLPAHLQLAQMVAKDVDSNQKSEDTKRHDFLLCWKEIKGSAATYSQLINALLKIDCAQDAEKVCEILGGSQPQPQQLNSSGASNNASATGVTGT